MFPANPALDKVNCLASLIGIRSACAPGAAMPTFFLEDIDGLDIQKLAKTARASSLKGEDSGKFLIASAAREMMGDIEALMNNGYSIKNMVGDVCSTCSLLPTYTANAGIVIKSATPSLYQRLLITKLDILTNVTGTRELRLDDGNTVETYDVELQAGVIMPVLLDYSTYAKSVKVSFTDPTVGLGQVYCQQPTSCGCGGSVTANNPITITGLLAGNEVATQYGFLPCASVGCSYDLVVCKMLQQAPNLFGMALLYKIGEKWTIIRSQTERNNSTASYNDEPEELTRNYGQLYWAKMKGSKNGSGLAKVINDYLRLNATDKCVTCEAKVYTSYATG